MTNQTTNKKLLDQVRDTLRLKHYALNTEESYLLWIKRYIFFHKMEQGFVHPKDMDLNEIEAFLTHLAVEKKVAPSTHTCSPEGHTCTCVLVQVLGRCSGWC